MNIIIIDIGKIKFDIVLGIFIISALISITFFNILLWLFFVATFLIILLKRKERIEIEPQKRELRRCVSVNTFSINSKWTKLPELEYITIARNNGTSGANLGKVETTVEFKQFPVKLVVNDERRFITIKNCTEKEDAIDLAVELGNALNLNVLDYTEMDKKWIRLE